MFTWRYIEEGFFVMTRLEKIKLALKKGYTYNQETGLITGVSGKSIQKKSVNGYIVISLWYENKRYYLYAHQFAYYIHHQDCPKCIDHINMLKTDNRIENLRSVTKQENAFNMRDVKGYSYDKRSKKYIAMIMVNGKKKQLGSFKTKELAHNCYLLNKSKYHIINK